MEFFVTIFESVTGFLVEHAAFFAIAALLTYVCRFMATRVFTKERAYATTFRANVRALFWYGRETLPLHPILAGAVLGVFWRQPETRYLPMLQSVTYFAAAGLAGMIIWLVLKAVAKKRGLVIEDPWSSSLPPLYCDEPRLPLPGKLPTLSPKMKATIASLARAEIIRRGGDK